MASAVVETLVIGMGNVFRGDDAVGLVVARRLKSRNLAGVHILEHDGDCLTLIDDWNHADRVIVIDAAASGKMPGTIHCLDACDTGFDELLSHCSTHSVGLHDAVSLARRLGRLPERLTVYAVEGRSFELGTRLSPEVARAACEVEEEIHRELSGNHNR